MTATLESLTLGSLTLSPAFDRSVNEYSTTYRSPDDLSETVTITAVPTQSGSIIDVSYGDADKSADTYTHVENGGEIQLYGFGASMNRVVLVDVTKSGAKNTYRINVAVRPVI